MSNCRQRRLCVGVAHSPQRSHCSRRWSPSSSGPPLCGLHAPAKPGVRWKRRSAAVVSPPSGARH
eukprot:scaffold80215_cov62-Phaeocystis_antarctica.AAC.1